MRQNQVSRISAVQAKKMMEQNADYILLDVRTRQEYDQGHIQGAKLLPYDQVLQRAKEALPDRDALILIYCRSGRRSLQAANDLAELGYSRIYEFGGILDWPFDTMLHLN